MKPVDNPEAIFGPWMGLENKTKANRKQNKTQTYLSKHLPKQLTDPQSFRTQIPPHCFRNRHGHFPEVISSPSPPA